jgi:hypothetical protein
MNHLLHNLSIRSRLLAILIVFLIPIAILAFELNGRLAESIDFSAQENEGAQMVLPLFKAFGGLADYEVASMQKASGNATVDKDISTAVAEVDGRFVILNKLAQQYRADLDLDSAGLKKHGRPETLTIENIEKRWQSAKSAP